jgi:glucose/arabinose dehydrogenase
MPTGARALISLIATSVLLAAITLPVVSERAGASTLPEGFTDTVVWSGRTLPTNLAFAPNGKVFLAEKSGRIWVYDNTADTSATLFKDLSTNVFNFWDRGLLGLTVDPRLGNGTGHDYVYVSYAKDAPPGQSTPYWGDDCPTPPEGDTDGCVVLGRLSRIPVNANGTAGAEQVMIDNEWCQQFTTHSLGDLHFGADGMLYVTGGEGAGYASADWGQFGGSLPGTPTPVNPCGDPPGAVGVANTSPTGRGGALRAQSVRRPAGEPRLLSGTLLRINPDTANAEGAPGNPMFDPDNKASNASRIVAYGFRNPFRFTMRPGTNEAWVGNVGWGSWEEIDRIENPLASPAYNSGWPCLENETSLSGYRDLDLCQTLYRDTADPPDGPYLAYRHGDPVNANDTCLVDDGTSISGAAFYTGDSYGPEYKNALFFADVSKNCIMYMPAGANGLPDKNNVKVFVDDADNPRAVDLETDPASGDIFYVDIFGGKVHRISRPVGPASSVPPSIAPTGPIFADDVLTASPGTWTGSQPIAFSYQWQRCSPACSNIGGATSAQYTVQAGDSGKKLRVWVTATNAVGSSTAFAETGVVDNHLPTAIIDLPAVSTNWKANDTVSFAGHATDPEDGALPESALSWQIKVAHCPIACHEHPLATRTGVSGGTIAAPSHGAPSYLVFELTATDSAGESTTVTRSIDPQVATLTLQSNPPGLTLTAGDQEAQAPFTQAWVVNSQVQVSAPASQTTGGVAYTFAGWSDGGAATHIVNATASTTYTATYTAVVTQPPPPAPTPPPPVTQSVPAGYWMIGGHGSVYAFGNVAHLGNAPTTNAVDLEPTPDGNGYWIVDAAGHVFAHGNARTLGNATDLAPGEVVTSLSRTKSGNGYWLFTTRGRALAFGDAPFLGDMRGVPLNGPVLDSVSTPSGNGYYMVASDGGVFSFGDAAFHGSMGGRRLNAPVQSLVPDGDGAGYWLVASDGGIFAFDAPFHGSMGSQRLNRPVTGMVRFGDAYLMVGEDGGIFNFSNQPFFGSLGSSPPSVPIVSVAAFG